MHVFPLVCDSSNNIAAFETKNLNEVDVLTGMNIEILNCQGHHGEGTREE
jgi:hypothetical protein